MTEKHYVVSLEKGYDKEEIMNDLYRDTTKVSSVDSTIIPDRQVQEVNKRGASKRIFEVALTDEEARALRNDPRVGGVNEPLVWSNDWLDEVGEPVGDPIIASTDELQAAVGAGWFRGASGSFQNNWGLRRHIEQINPWGGGNQGFDIGGTYGYHLDGTGVDYVHQEGGTIRYSHNEFKDKNGVSRIEEFQWNTLPNCSGCETMVYDNTNEEYHATHCAGTAVGLNTGWAKNARIYSMPTSYISQAYWFDAIKEFHKNKSVDPKTGHKRPTVVSASWGFKAQWEWILEIYFRGVNVGSTKSRDYGMIGDGSNRFNASLFNLQTEVEEMEDEGVIYIKSAGNQYQKLCYPGDIDYDNHITSAFNITGTGILYGDPIYYNRGAGNIGPNTVVVGNLDSTLYNDNETTLASSDKGPRVDLWAAGTGIISSFTGNDGSYQFLSGTSMATPQVSGMTCLLLQLNPGMTPAQVREWWINNSIKNFLWQGPTDESNASTFFANDKSLFNGPNRIAYFPYQAHKALRIG